MARTIRIKVQPHVPGGRFCRAGRCFGTQPTELAEADLTSEQLAALQAEPMLLVEITEEVKPTAPQAKAEAKAEEEAKPGDQPPAGEQEQQAGDGQPAPAAPAKPVSQPKPAAKPAATKDGK
jgi:hypothetical protein